MRVISREAMIKAEAEAVKEGESYLSLMEMAGTAAAEYIIKTVSPEGKAAVLLCGRGNNGGDGFVIARQLAARAASVTAVLLGEPTTDSAKQMYSRLPSSVNIISAEKCEEEINGADIIVDALFGTGLDRSLEGMAARLCELANNASAVRFAVDIPSGVECDTGKILGNGFKADYTVSFAALKPCHILPPANALAGELFVADIGISDGILSSLPALAETVSPPVLEKRDKNGHKGSYKTAMSVCGSYGMSGAALMSSEAALRSGIGIMKTAVIPENYEILARSLPESVLIPCESKGGRYSRGSLPLLREGLKGAAALLIGCGLSVTPDTAYITRELALSSRVPVIIDADGINAVADDIEFIKQMKAPLVLTPHSGEMSRLCGRTVTEIEADRIGTARDFALKWGAHLVLKGANTLVATPEGKILVNMNGNAGMATGGSGDVLSGIMLTCLAQDSDITRAVSKAVYLHGAAGDIAAEHFGETSLLPRDMIAALPSLLKNR